MLKTVIKIKQTVFTLRINCGIILKYDKYKM